MKTLESMKMEYKGIFYNKTIVFGQGKAHAKIMVVGEAPGATEEELGRPFVGKAGKNLDEFLNIVNLRRESIYITNVVKIRPTKASPKTGKLVNRPPSKEEVVSFLPLLEKEIEEIAPKLIVTLGNIALKAVSKNMGITIGAVHGTLLESYGLRIFPLYHPAAIIYNQSLKATYYKDLENITPFLF